MSAEERERLIDAWQAEVERAECEAAEYERLARQLRAVATLNRARVAEATQCAEPHT